MQRRLHWLDYDPVAFAVLVTGMGMIALLAFSIFEPAKSPLQRTVAGFSLGRSIGRPFSLHNPQIRIFALAIKSVALLRPTRGGATLGWTNRRGAPMGSFFTDEEQLQLLRLHQLT